MREDRWITVPNWERFQHYGQARRPIWIKNYNALLRKDEYLDLTLGLRGLLHGIWLAYADREGRLRCRDLNATLQVRARTVHMTSLAEAGFIEFSASKPLLLDLNPVDTHAREERVDRARERRVENWIHNGVVAEIPKEDLARIIADELKTDDPETIDRFVAQAQEWQP